MTCEMYSILCHAISFIGFVIKKKNLDYKEAFS